MQANKALSAIDLVERLKSEMNKTTVYRILERLEDKGMIHLRERMACNGIQSARYVPPHITQIYIRIFSVGTVVRRNVWI
jgi:Fur family ferric uptake transcriptional regulator